MKFYLKPLIKNKMTMRYFTTIFILLLLCLWSTLPAQQTRPDLPEELQQDTGNTGENSLGLKMRKHQGDVLIKIVPRHTDAFMHFKENGWVLERATIREGDTS